MNVTTKLDFDRIAENTPFTVRLMVSAEGEAPAAGEKRHLNLAVVLDRSGSMGGGKIEAVKEATRALASSMGRDDLFSLTVFDDRVDALVEPAPVGGGEARVAAAIDSIDTGGSTNLGGGYEQGAAFARRNLAEGSVTRILLLTDGQANVGTVDPAALSDLAGGYRAGGITTTTLGVGARYNEELLAAMAEAGGGASYFIEGPEDARSIFEEELGFLANLAATGLEVRFTPASPAVRAAQLNRYAVGEDGAFRLGDVYGGQARSLLLEIGLPPMAAPAGGMAPLGTLDLSWREAVEGGFEDRSLRLPVEVSVVSAEEFAAVAPDREVTLQAALLAAAAAKLEAVRRADGQRFEEAAAILEACAGRLEALGLGDPALDGQIRDLRERAERLRFERERFFDAVQRKRMYHEFDLGTKGESMKLRMMRERQAQKEAAAFHPVTDERSYRCYVNGGHLLAEIGDDRVLVDTGSPSTFGNPVGGAGRIRLGRREFVVPRDYLGQAVGDIEALVGTRFSVLLGTDAIAPFDVRVDLAQGELAVTEREMPLDGAVVPLDRVQGIPVVPVEVDGRTERFVLDTGAKLSYLHSALAAPHPVVRHDTDFLPGVGRFRTEVREVPVRFAGEELSFRFGTLPAVLEAALSLLGVRGILGSALFEEGAATFAFRRGRLSFRRY